MSLTVGAPMLLSDAGAGYNNSMRITVSVFIMAALFFSGCVQRYYNLATGSEEMYVYSSEREERMGASLARQVEQTVKPLPDALIQQRVNEIGQKIAEVCDRQEIPYNFKVLDEKEKNAFALPGGYVYIFRGLWDDIAAQDDMIAAVLAHEVAHISARHSIKRLQHTMSYGVLGILVNTPVADMDAQSRAQATAGIYELLLDYSREEELEADTLSVGYLKRAGYSTTAVVDVLHKLQDIQRALPVGPQHALTHPYITDRVSSVTAQMKEGAIEFDDYINTTKKP